MEYYQYIHSESIEFGTYNHKSESKYFGNVIETEVQ